MAHGTPPPSMKLDTVDGINWLPERCLFNRSLHLHTTPSPQCAKRDGVCACLYVSREMHSKEGPQPPYPLCLGVIFYHEN